MLTFFDNVYSLDIPDSPETFYHAGNAFGRFLKEMADVDAEDVKEVIPNFHNTKSRYQDLEKSIARDPKGRVKDVQAEIEFVRARADKYGMISDALESGKLAYFAADVVSKEPISAENPLLTAKNCILTPHIAWAPKETRQRLHHITAENIRAFLNGTPQNVVNP